MKNPEPFYLGHVKVYPTLNLLEIKGTRQKMEPKVMQVLMFLVEHDGQVVRKEDIIEAIWGDVIVVDKVLTRAISQLRKHFNDDPNSPKVIATVSKVGYRLILRPQRLKKNKKTFRNINEVTWPILFLIALIVISIAITYATYPKSTRSKIPSTPTIPLTNFYSWEYDPSLSPDGQLLAFVWNGMNTLNWNIKYHNTRSWDIYMKSMVNDSIYVFSEMKGSEGSPVWSPDGQHLIFYRLIGKDSTEIWMKSVFKPQSSRKLISCRARYPDLSWSADGKFLAFNEKSLEEGSPYHISMLSLITMEKTQMTVPDSIFWGDHQASFSPDGRYLAFTRAYSEGVQEIWSINLKTKQLKQLTHLQGNINGHDWSEDGNAILFSSNTNGSTVLQEVRIPGQEVSLLYPGLSVSNPQLRGKKLVFESWQSETNIWRLNLSNRSFMPFIASTSWDQHPAFSPLNTQLAFVSNRSGSYEIWIKDMENGKEKRLTNIGEGFVSNPSWFSNGQQLAFERRIAGQSDIYLFHLGTAELHPLVSFPADELSPTFSKDGRWLYFSSSRNGSWNIWRKSMLSDTIEQITINGGFGPRLDQKDSLLYYTKHHDQGLWQISIEEKTEQLVLPDISNVDWGNWALSHEGIFFIKRKLSPLKDEVLFYNLADHSITSIIELEDQLPIKEHGLELSPNGKQLLIGQLNRASCDIKYLEVDLKKAK